MNKINVIVENLLNGTKKAFIKSKDFPNFYVEVLYIVNMLESNYKQNDWQVTVYKDNVQLSTIVEIDDIDFTALYANRL